VIRVSVTIRALPLALGLAALPACGEALQPPAAVVDGVDIEMDELEDVVRVVLADAVPGSEPTRSDERKRITRQLLSLLIQFEILSDYARDHEITVTDEEVQEEIDLFLADIGGREAFDRQFGSRGVTDEDLHRFVFRELLGDKVRDAIAAEVGGPNAAAAVEGWLGDRLMEADIAVNPRFGVLDVETGEIRPLDSVLQ
jgi:hypothetical protein